VKELSTPAGRPASSTARVVRPWSVRALRHGLAATLAVLVVCAVIGAFSALSYSDATARLATLTGRAVGKVTGADPADAHAAEINWTTGTGRGLRATVELTGALPATGTRTQIAFDPRDPAEAIIPGAALLTDADSGRGGILFAALVALVVLVIDGVWLARRYRLRARPAGPLLVRRIRVQRRLLSRSWLETEPVAGQDRKAGRQRWIPVYFDPVLAELPAPVEVRLHGDLRRGRLVAVEVTGSDGLPRMLYPAGRAAASEPLGRRTDSPSRPDAYAITKARAVGTLRQLRVDAALMVPAPLIGLFWAYLDSGGVPSWFAATALGMALAIWWAALRGSDPT
jgi:hypothetical protein